MTSNPLRSRKLRDELKRSGKIIWTPVRRGLALGYRASARSWIARAFAKGRLLHKRLGDEADLPSFDEAKDRAEDWFKRVRGEAPLGYTVLDAIEDYTRSQTADGKRPWNELRSLAKHIPGELLAREIEELRTGELEDWRNALPVKPATRARVFSTLGAALRNAYRLHGVGSLDTYRRMRPVRVPKPERARLFIPTDQQVAELIARADKDFAPLVRAAAMTGCRYSELTHLEVRDFDARKGRLDIRRSKTGPRTMLLSSAAVSFFNGQVRDKLPHARIFTRAGEPWRASNQQGPMARAAAAAPGFVFYSLRHYALSKQLSAGVPAAMVAKNAGTSEMMLRQHYHKFLPEDRGVFDRVPALAE